MKRFHVHVGVSDLDQSISFYSSLFGAAVTLVRSSSPSGSAVLESSRDVKSSMAREVHQSIPKRISLSPTTCTWLMP